MSISGSIRIFFAFLCLMFSATNNIYADPADQGGGGRTDNNAIENTLCTVVNSLTGGIGRGIATIAIIALAIGLFLGKLSWGLAMATGIGVGMVFGAKTVVEWLSKNASGPGGTANPAAASTVCP